MRMRIRTSISGLISIVAVMTASAAQIGSNVSTLLESNQRARAVLARAVDAHGGEAALRAIDTVWLEERGHTYMRTQGPRPGRPVAARPIRTIVMLNFGRTRGCVAPDPFTHSDTTRVEEMLYVYHPRTIVRDGSVHQLDMRTRSRAAPRTGSLQALLTQQRYLPSAWLLEALTSAHSLRWVEQSGGSSLVAMTTSDGRAVALRIGSDGLLASVERLTTDPAEGDAVTSTEFSDYRRIGGVMLPGRRTGHVGGDVVFDVRNERFTVNQGIDEACLEIPKSFAVWPPAGPRPETKAAISAAASICCRRSVRPTTRSPCSSAIS
jgi:hypothetical protein